MEFPLLIPFVSAPNLSGYVDSNVLHHIVSISFWKAKITPNLESGNITIPLISVRLHSVRIKSIRLIKYAGLANQLPANGVEVSRNLSPEFSHLTQLCLSIIYIIIHSLNNVLSLYFVFDDGWFLGVFCSLRRRSIRVQELRTLETLSSWKK
jgi:hypothetical protein